MNHFSLIRRFAAWCTAMMLLCFCLPSISVSAETEVQTISSVSTTSTQQVNNIVLFAQFDSLTEKNFMASTTTQIQNLCNDTSTYRSLVRYIDTISDGQMQVTSYFPQLQNNVIIPYVLQSSRADYTDYGQYVTEMVENITIPESIPLDGNQDGVVDNVICIVDGAASETDDPLWSKAFHISGLKINGCTVDTINLHAGDTLMHSTIFYGVATLCHEFLHSMGYPDLYRNDDKTGIPVGQWDIMATTSIFLQYPLAYQRYTSGWLKAETITKSGTYTISLASAKEGNRLYLLKSPLSETEFFAVEYRKPGTANTDELDGKIYGEGLVVYRINTKKDGNYGDDADEIYVFRPGETTCNAGEGDLTQSCYGGTNAPDHIGTIDLEKGITEDALVYTDGTNSGIALDQIQIQENGTMTFSVSFAEFPDMEYWQTVNTSILPTGTQAYDWTTATDGTQYLFTATSNAGAVYQMQSGQLTAVSTPISGTIHNPKLELCNGTFYVLYQDAEYRAQLCQWDAEEAKWKTCYSSDTLVQYQDLTTDGNLIYFAGTVGTFPYQLQVRSYDPKTDQITILEERLSENACNLEMAAAGGKVLIGYRDLTESNIPKAAIFDGTAWNTVQLSDQSCETVSVLAEENRIWILPSGGKNPVFCFKNSTITSYDLPDELKDRAFQMIPAAWNGTFYMAVNAQNPESLDLYRLQKETGTWEKTGNTITAAIVNNPILTVQGGMLDCFYTDSEQTIQWKQLRISEESEIILKGDVNLDGKLNLADVVLYSRYLLRKGSMTEEQAKRADTIEDGSINVLDLVWLKWQLQCKG